METFKVGDRVYVEEDFIYGRIVEIEGCLACVEFKDPGFAGCLVYKLSQLKHEKWCITTDDTCNNEILYLAWQNHCWNVDGYYWTSKENFEKLVDKSTKEHPFLFNSRKSAIKHLKSINIPQKCRIIRW